MSLLTGQHFPNEIIADLRDIPDQQVTLEESFDTTAFIYSLINQNTITEDQDLILDRLCKKIDVTKRICSHYSLDLKQSLDKKSVDQRVLKALSLILIQRARENKDLKFLNTAFKIIDTHLEKESHQLMIIAEDTLSKVFL